VRPQTFRHLTVCALMGVKSIIIAINKMDLVGYEHATFEEISGQVKAAAARLGLDEVMTIPVSAVAGDNVTAPTTHMPWWHGPSLLSALQEWTPPESDKSHPFRLPVQFIARAEGNFRGYAGTVAAGVVRPGDKVVVADSGQTATISRIVGFHGDMTEAAAGDAVTVTLDREVDVTRGDLIAADGTTESGETAWPQPADRFAADVVWVGEEALMHGRSYLLAVGPRTVPATVTVVRHRLDVVSGQKLAARVLDMNDIGRIEIATDTPIPMDMYSECRDTGGFLLIDRVSADTVAAGMVTHALRRSLNVVPHSYEVDRDARARLKHQTPRVLWLTGLSGSGKSTVADALERRLYALGMHTFVLDGDNVRTGINKDLGFTPEDRAENVRRVAEAAKLMLDAGLIVIVALISPFRADRRAAREIFDDGDFLEVFVDTPVEMCATRDPKGLYAKAQSGTLPNMTGIGQEYEPPEHADVHLDGTAAVDDNVEILVRRLAGE
jgi:bifunctional enzyme CysN/CysC